MAYAIVDKNPAVREVVIDTADDLATVKKTHIAPGSTVFVIATKKKYMLSNANTWEEITEQEQEEQQ